MSIRVDLSNCADRFIASSQELVLENKRNFIFGKNGTGKTTIADEIKKQLSEDYDVCVFKDFDNVAENERLDAVALGRDNADIQKKISAIDMEISTIEKQIEQPNGDFKNSLSAKVQKAQEYFSRQERNIEKFFTSSARKIKNLNNPQVASTTYDKNSFKKDIEMARFLSEESINTSRNIIKADKKHEIESLSFPVINLQSYMKSTNEILQTCVTQMEDIAGLSNNPEKQAFARQGIHIHEHKVGEICAFCGGKISEARWEQLGNYFNDEV